MDKKFFDITINLNLLKIIKKNYDKIVMFTSIFLFIQVIFKKHFLINLFTPMDYFINFINLNDCIFIISFFIYICIILMCILYKINRNYFALQEGLNTIIRTMILFVLIYFNIHPEYMYPALLRFFESNILIVSIFPVFFMFYVEILANAFPTIEYEKTFVDDKYTINDQIYFYHSEEKSLNDRMNEDLYSTEEKSLNDRMNEDLCKKNYSYINDNFIS